MYLLHFFGSKIAPMCTLDWMKRLQASWNLKRYIYTSVKSNNISISIGRYQHFLTFSYFLDYQSITKVREKKGCSLVQLKGQRAKNANVGKYFTIILEFSNQWLTFKRSTFPTSEITFPPLPIVKWLPVEEDHL